MYSILKWNRNLIVSYLLISDQSQTVLCKQVAGWTELKLSAASRIVLRRLATSKANTYIMAYAMGAGGCWSLIEPTLVPK